MTGGGWVDQVYRESELASGYQGQRVLERLLKELTPVCGLPELEIAHDRRPCNSATMVLDAWGMQPDESLGTGPDGVPYDSLYVIGFLDGRATRESILSLEACGDAIRGMSWFYQRSARDGGGSVKPLHEITSPSEASYNAARYISDERATIKHVQFILITTLPGDEEKLQWVADVALHNEGLGEIGSVDVWTLPRLERLRTIGADEGMVVLDLTELDEGSLPGQQPAPHPVIECGIEGGWEVYLTSFTGHQIARFYGRHRQRLLNENVRAFLQFSTKTNKAILATIKSDPVKFVSYNNGISIVAQSATKTYQCAEDCCGSGYVTFVESCPKACCTAKGGARRQANVDALSSLHDAQIVNGGQTTAAIFHASRDPIVRRSGSLGSVRVPVKITIVSGSTDDRDDAIALIAKFANTQNSIKAGDLESNNQFFRRLEAAAGRIAAPSGPRTGSFWVFERTRGRYAETAQLEGPDWLRAHPQEQKIDKYLLADVMNCVSARPYEAQLGGDALFARYLRWLRSNGGRAGKKGALAERLFFADSLIDDEDQALQHEWAGIVGSVLVRRELERVFAETEGYLRSISYRYVLALAYRAFGTRWRSIWDHQNVEEAYRRVLSGSAAAAGTSEPTFSAWAVLAGGVVKEGVEQSRLQTDGTTREVNYTGKIEETWSNVLRIAKENRLIIDG
ncbi:MAG: hypothetical protein JW395_2460 [Nitrospira sp.]|nr:hypothetical protein [Nitrospira sp.]